MTDFPPDHSAVVQPPLAPPPTAHQPKKWQNITPWLVTLVLHGAIFAGGYALYQRAVQSNQTLANVRPAKPQSATAMTTQQNEVLLTLSDSTTPIAIQQETYAPSPKVRSDLPILTTADIIAQGNAIRAAQEGNKADSAVSATAITALSAVSSTAKTLAKGDTKPVEKTTTVMMDASDEALTDRDLPAKDRKSGTKLSPDAVTSDSNAKANAHKADKKSTATTSQGKIQKTDQAKQTSQEADQLSKSLDETNADLSRNIDIIKNKNRQRIAKEFNPKTPVTTADDRLHSEDVPTKK